MSNQTPNQNKADQQRQNPDQKREQDQKPGQQADNRKAEIRKAVEQDKIDPNNPQGQENTEYSGGS